jgi:hypothetical protein
VGVSQVVGAKNTTVPFSIDIASSVRVKIAFGSASIEEHSRVNMKVKLKVNQSEIKHGRTNMRTPSMSIIEV